MKVSIVTAVYNRVEVIADCMNSIYSQTYGDFEHIIQDGCSVDGTLSVIARNADSRASLVSEPDSGIYDAINRGIRRSTGDIVGLLHSDDVFADRFVLEQIAEVMTDPSIDAVYGDIVYINNSTESGILRRWVAGEFQLRKLKFGWMPPHTSIFVRREIFDRFGYYDTQFTISADYDLVLRWLTCGELRFDYLPSLIVMMRNGGESNGSLKKILRKMREDVKVIRRHRLPGLSTLICKNVRKIPQFINK